jgi:hypothetical protein
MNKERNSPCGPWVGASKQHHLINKEDPIIGPQLKVMKPPKAPPTFDVVAKERHPPSPLRKDHNSLNLTLEVIKDLPPGVKVLTLPNTLHQAVAKQSYSIMQLTRNLNHRVSYVDVAKADN